MPSNTPFGFRPHRHLAGGLIRSVEYTIASAYGTAIYSGDCVKLLSDGTIASAAAGDRILGIFDGVKYTNSDGDFFFRAHWPASTALQTGSTAKALVYVDPMITYMVQSAGTPATTNIGNLADHVVGTGDGPSGVSGASLSGTMGTGTAGFRILGIWDAPGNSGQYAILEVQPWEFEFASHDQATAGV